jgi:hypothetical protein
METGKSMTPAAFWNEVYDPAALMVGQYLSIQLPMGMNPSIL